MKSSLNLYIGRDKGEATIVAAPDLANAQTMVDASTKLYRLAELRGKFTLEYQGKIDAEKLLECLCTGNNLKAN